MAQDKVLDTFRPPYRSAHTHDNCTQVLGLPPTSDIVKCTATEYQMKWSFVWLEERQPCEIHAEIIGNLRTAISVQLFVTIASCACHSCIIVGGWPIEEILKGQVFHSYIYWYISGITDPRDRFPIVFKYVRCLLNYFAIVWALTFAT